MDEESGGQRHEHLAGRFDSRDEADLHRACAQMQCIERRQNASGTDRHAADHRQQHEVSEKSVHAAWGSAEIISSLSRFS